MEHGGDATRSNFIEILEVRGGSQQQRRRGAFSSGFIFAPAQAQVRTRRGRVMVLGCGRG